MALNILALQKRLKVTADGKAGTQTWAALFKTLGAKDSIASELGKSAAAHFQDYGLLDNPLRLAHFLAQTGHESGGFVYMKELGGPAYFKKYDGRKDLGNVHPGDGAKFSGRGILQLTGRSNYRAYGAALGMDFEANPEQVAQPAIGLLVALHYWQTHKLNALADADDIVNITRKINGGSNGLADRKLRLVRAKALVL
jgi:putative chitinase